MTGPAPASAAPADARPHRPWPLWRKVVAYAVAAALAALAIWYVDRKAQLGGPLKTAAPADHAHARR